MASALPQQPYQMHHYAQNAQRYNSAPAMTPQLSGSQFRTPATMAPLPVQSYYAPPQNHMAQFYQHPLPQQATTMAQRPEFGYYPNSVAMGQAPHPGAPYYYHQPAPYPGPVPHVQGQVASGQYVHTNTQQAPEARPQHQQQQNGKGTRPSSQVQHGKGSSTDDPNNVRGPPRKPRQTVEHVCKLTQGLESLFLITHSNCAFANYRDEQTWSAAQPKLHDSPFKTVRLMARLRRCAVKGPAGVMAPTGPAASPAAPVQEAGERVETPGPKDNGTVSSPSTTAPSVNGRMTPHKDRFFIIKSVTLEDIELAVKNSIWATQAHNEERLNAAFKNSENVYLFFSANKSGGYFGYARMTSPLNEDPAAAVQFAPRATSGVKAVPMPATEFIPKGRIIDDSDRDGIFWEAVHKDDNKKPSKKKDVPDKTDSNITKANDINGTQHEAPSSTSLTHADTTTSGTASSTTTSEWTDDEEEESWGKPFEIQWLSTTPLPFYRVKSLRNPWNQNREVKVARDGTEIEPSVGLELIRCFNKEEVLQAQAQVQAQVQQSQGVVHMVPQMGGTGHAVGVYAQGYHH
ncbi:hypothetical protein N0V88_004482 [Collariella sp. IMI 366227]|nr:hypothetical protein N0V88_004482 [Collariella sp. IMI 366227]